MDSKTRVGLALSRKYSDRVPLGLYTIDHDVIAKVIGRPTYLRNKTAIQIAIWEGRRDEIVDSMKADVVDLYRELDCVDLLTLKEAYRMPPRGYVPENPPEKIGANLYKEQNGCVWQAVPEANEIAIVENPAAPVELPEYDESDYADRTEPVEEDPTCFELSDHLIANFRNDRYIAGYAGDLVSLTLLGGTEFGLMTMAMQPEVVKAFNEQYVFMENIHDKIRIRPGVDGVLIEQDMAGTNGPLISPTMFRELGFPYMKERIESIKKYVPQVILHNCGNNLPLMDMFIDAGIDGYESIQTTSAMSLEVLARDYSDRLCIWGSVPLEVLIMGDTADARKAVRECMEIGKRIPGFILGPSHSIAFGTKYDNFMAMLDEFVKLRDRV